MWARDPNNNKKKHTDDRQKFANVEKGSFGTVPGLGRNNATNDKSTNFEGHNYHRKNVDATNIHPVENGKLLNVAADRFKTDHLVDDNKHTRTTISKTATFGSRKRKLTRIEFVRPKIDGVADPFCFGKSFDFVELDLTNIKTLKDTAPSQNNKQQSIDDILNRNDFLPSRKKSGAESDIQEANHVYHSRTIHSPETIMKTPFNSSEERNDTSFEDSIKSSQKYSRSQFCGISVEDAVRDRLGLRPRANSTDAELRLPQRGLCDEQMILEKYRWKFDPTGRPKGFHNLGNTCFLNSTLQCLAYLPPFCQSMMAITKGTQALVTQNNGMNNHHTKISNGKRITYILRELFHKVHGKNSYNNNGAAALAPNAIVKAVPSLGSSGNRAGYKFRPGRQEDAHEFLVHLLDAMHDGELREAGIYQNKSGWRDRLPVPRLDETTFIHRIFGGYFRSQVRCTNCGYRSNTYDPFLDLSLEISKKSCTSIIGAINEFTRKETLDPENKWLCSGCKQRVCASKQLTVFRPPLSLCIQLKRFLFKGNGNKFYGGFSSFGGIGGGTKITKPIEFPAHLELPLSDKRSCSYSLCGIVIHVGSNANSGHYTACVKQGSLNRRDRWYCMDDSDADPVSEATVLRQKDAYLLFYCREEVKLEFPPPPRGLTEKATKQHPSEIVQNREERQQRERPKTNIGTDFNSNFSQIDSNMNNDKSGQEKKLPEKEQLKIGTMATTLPLHDENIITGSRKLQEDTIHVRDDSVLSDVSVHVQKCNDKSSPSPDASYLLTISTNEAQPSVLEKSSVDGKAMSVNETHQEQSKPDFSLNDSNAKNQPPATSKTTKIISNRDGQRIEVVMRSHSKNAIGPWMPQSFVGSKEKNESFGLLGAIPVKTWDEEESDTSDHESRPQRSTSSTATNNSRALLVATMEKKEKDYKRKTYLDRWDSSLDQGKTKKVKKNRPGPDWMTPTSARNNPFQRIQVSLQKMTKGKPKGHVRKSNAKFTKRR